ncbi:MAG TPA: class I SAM-dependent methyltransferase [Streptosporangiaceae bacterium]
MTDLGTAPIHEGDPFSERVREYSRQRPPGRIQMLEAGCGWGRGLALGDLRRHVTGVDLDLPALRARTLARTDLDGWHLGDLRTVPLPPREYDVVHAPYLIDRIPQAELVLDRLVAALKPGGLLLVRLRDRCTAYGLIDRMLPWWLRARLAAGDGVPPTAVYEPVASREGMRWYCVMRGLVVTEEYTSRKSVAAFGRWAAMVIWLGRMLATLSGNRLPADHSEVMMVIRKPENRFARVI